MTDARQLLHSARHSVVERLRSYSVTARLASELRLRSMRRDPAHRPLWECLKRIQPGTTVLDVGASVGHYSLAFSHAVGREGRVLALEPNPTEFAVLRHTTWRSRVEPLNIAASDSDRTAVLHLPIDDEGHDLGPLGSLESRASADHGGAVREVEVACRRLDDLVPVDAKVSLIKVDVEGHEANALHGASGLLERARPVVVCEIEQRHLPQSSVADVVALMEGWNYDAHAITATGLKPWAEFDVQRDQLDYVDADGELTGAWEAHYLNNFVFLPR